MTACHIIILDIFLNADHDLNLYLGLNSWTWRQIMILNLAPEASFVDPCLSLIKSILVLLRNPFFLLLNSHFSQVGSALSSSSSCCAVSLAWEEELTALMYDTSSPRLLG